MLNMAAFIVVKNDEFYIDMALKSVLPYVKGIYIQDQMSDDGTDKMVADLLNSSREAKEKIFFDRVDTGIKERFNPLYDEPRWRTLAVENAESIFHPEWILKLDADEIYTEYFFKSLAEILPGAKFEGVRVSGDRFVTPRHRAILGVTHLEHTEYSPQGGAFVDPHTQVWRAGKYYYRTNPDMPGQFFHPVLRPDPQPQYWLPGICNIHLHRIFGPKAFKFWAEGGDVFKEKTPFHPPSMAPKWFNAEVNMGTVEEVDFKWPDFVMEKWREWGVW